MNNGLNLIIQNLSNGILTFALLRKMAFLMALVALHRELTVSLWAVFSQVALLVAAVALSYILGLVTLLGEVPVFATVVASWLCLVTVSPI